MEREENERGVSDEYFDEEQVNEDEIKAEKQLECDEEDTLKPRPNTVGSSKIFFRLAEKSKLPILCWGKSLRRHCLLHLPGLVAARDNREAAASAGARYPKPPMCTPIPGCLCKRAPAASARRPNCASISALAGVHEQHSHESHHACISAGVRHDVWACAP